MTKEIKEHLDSQLCDFIANHSIQAFAADLRSMLLQHIRLEMEIGLKASFPQFLAAFEDLFLILDTMAGDQETREM